MTELTANDRRLRAIQLGVSFASVAVAFVISDTVDPMALRLALVFVIVAGAGQMGHLYVRSRADDPDAILGRSSTVGIWVLATGIALVVLALLLYLIAD